MTAADNKHDDRIADVEQAINGGFGFDHLCVLWKVSRPGAWQWCNRYCTEDEMAALAKNGMQGRLRWSLPQFEHRSTTGDRLFLIELMRNRGWSTSRLARAMGIQPQSLHLWIKANAPEGVSEALSDFRDDDITPAPARAA